MDKNQESLTWDELADIYDEMTGGTARTRPMNSIFDWAERHPEMFFIDEDGYLYKIPTKKRQ